MNFFCNGSNRAMRRYLRSMLGIGLSYLGLAFSSRLMVDHWHPKGWHVYIAALLPTIPMLCMAFVVGRYLREERDEYLRDITVRGILWGTAAALSLNTFASFLHAFGWPGQFPPFTEFFIFWLTVSAVQTTNRLRDRIGADE